MACSTEEADFVLSEVHVETCPPGHQGSLWNTLFELPVPTLQPSIEPRLDVDGDLALRRRSGIALAD